MDCIYKFGHLGASSEFIWTLQQPELIILLKDAGLHPISSDAAVSDLFGVEVGFTSVFIKNVYSDSTPSEVCFLQLLRVFGERKWTQQVFLKGALCQLLWKWLYTFGAISWQICCLMSHCLWPLGCALSHVSPVSWCSAQRLCLMQRCLISNITYNFWFVTMKGVRSWKPSFLEDAENDADSRPLSEPSVSLFPVQLVEIVFVPHIPFILCLFSLSSPQQISYVPCHTPRTSQRALPFQRQWLKCMST